jgi:peptidoglycan/LPS O-acetylase OafA/YrhL
MKDNSFSLGLFIIQILLFLAVVIIPLAGAGAVIAISWQVHPFVACTLAGVLQGLVPSLVWTKRRDENGISTYMGSMAALAIVTTGYDAGFYAFATDKGHWGLWFGIIGCLSFLAGYFGYFGFLLRKTLKSRPPDEN